MTALIDIHPDDLRSPGEVLAAAFHDHPTLRGCFGGDEPGLEGRLRGYLELGHRWHTGVGHPVHGVRAGDVLVGAAYAILPDIEIAPPQVAALRAALVERCGQPWAARLTDYNERVGGLRPDGRFHGIALVGVLPEWQGRGLGARMVDRVSALCDADPRSEGAAARYRDRRQRALLPVTRLSPGSRGRVRRLRRTRDAAPAQPDADTTPAGFAGLLRSDEDLPDLIYAMHPAHQGAGHATEAARVVLDHVFRLPGVKRVLASVDEPNVASVRVLEKLSLRLARRREQPEAGAESVLLYYELERPPSWSAVSTCARIRAAPACFS